MRVPMTPEQILSQLLKKHQRILHLGGDPELKTLVDAYEYTHVAVEDIGDFTSLPSGFDYVIMSDVLELVEDPVGLVKHVKDLAKTTVIYEYKYDEDCYIGNGWKTPWKTVGLEYTLTRNFDYVNNVFLGYATVHICDMPYTPKENNEDGIDAIR
jgi:hypothetical protein